MKNKSLLMLITALIIAINCMAQVSSKTETVADVDGNVYNTVTIGSQTWMAENLKVTKYNDGTSIPNVTGNNKWSKLTTGAMCNYKNTPSNSTTYGKLYNWHAVNTGKLCPTNWHVPTDAEWITLTFYLGGECSAGGKLKETDTTHWKSPNADVTNESGFTALPGGFRNNKGIFSYIIESGYWWSATEDSEARAWFHCMHFDNSIVFRNSLYKEWGFSMRCVKD